MDLKKVDEIKDPGKYSCVGGPFGSALSRKHYVEEAGVPVIRGTNLSDDRFHDKGFVFVSENKADELHRNMAFPGDLVFTQRGTLGQVALIPDATEFSRYVVSQSQMKLAVNRDIVDPYFVYIFFRSPLAKKIISDRAIVGGVPHINLGILKEIEIPVPTRSRQKEVVKIIRDIDRSIDNNRLLNQTLEQIAQAIFNSWFVDFEPVKAKQHIRALGGNDEQTERAAQAVIAGAVNLDVITTATDLSALDPQLIEALSEKLTHQTDAQREQLATTASHFPDQLVESELGLIPEGWEVSSIGDFADVIDCLHSKKPTEIVDGEGRLYLQLNNIGNDGLLHLDKQFLISDEDYSKWISRIEVTHGDCVITNVGRVGAVATIPRGAKAAIGRNMTAVRLHADRPYEGFLITLLTSAYMKSEIEYHTDAGTILNALNVRSIPKLRFYNPGNELLTSYEGVAAPLLDQRQQLVEEAASLAQARDVLLPKLISGELPVQDAA